MFCRNCGEELKADSKFCVKCGSKIEENIANGNITFTRIKQFYGVLVPIKVFLDGQEVASLKSGEEKTIPVSIGMHKLAFNLWSGKGMFDIEVTKENPNIKVSFKLSSGVVTTKPKIISIENI